MSHAEGSKDEGNLSLKELAKTTGLSESTLRRRVKDGSIPVIQLGGRGKKLLFPRTVVDQLTSPDPKRRQEAANTPKATIDTEHASRRKRSDGQVRRTRSRRSRAFPVHDDLRCVLQRIEHAADGRVIHGPKGGVLSPDITRRTLIRDVLAPLAASFPSRDDEIGFKDGRLHSFRHYFCSMCANNNVPEQLVMEWLGHQESKMVRHCYHAHDAEAQRQVKRINFTGGAAAD